jgi:hypothetical protein
MGQLLPEMLWRPKVISNVPAAPWDPTTLAARARAAQAKPAGTVVVEELVVEELGVLPGGTL